MGTKRWHVPEVAYEWMTDEIHDLLQAIQASRHVRKMRDSVVLLANAVGTGNPVKPVFGQEGVCCSDVWYRKWKKDPIIRAAYEACLERVLEYRDEQTAALEAHWSAVRRRNIAEKAAVAPIALAAVMADTGQKGGDRIEAATRLLKFSDPDLGKVQTGGTTAMSVDVEARVDGEILTALKALGLGGASGDNASE